MLQSKNNNYKRGEQICAETLRHYIILNLQLPIDEIYAASLQYVRKVSGFNKPSIANEDAFNRAVDEIAMSTQNLLNTLVTNASTT